MPCVVTAREFDRIVRAAKLSGRAVQAARLVLVDGLGVRAAAREAGLSGPAAVTRTVARIQAVKICPTCGQPIQPFSCTKS